MITEVGQESPTAFDGPRQIWSPRRITVATFTGAAGAAATVRFRLETPDSRCRTKVSLLFVPTPGAGVTPKAFAASLAATLWLYETESDETGSGGADIPCVDLQGTQSAPTAIPISSGLAGYSREFLTIGDGVEGELSFAVQAGEGATGVVALQTRFQPDGQRLPWKEWDEVRRQCSINLIGAALRR